MTVYYTKHKEWFIGTKKDLQEVIDDPLSMVTIKEYDW
ncbi:MAG: hypothetical protein AMQ22_02062 [Candidatus Methanofastidiosum methylothiophilum]|jgi:hypothetical protein|uniref:Uncharacterized protein n=1 Tax=Candidatus Methanofastidiosum methylothiophilum TaxID=1705564 RepID=A0A150IPD3_9EURY|nr:MAG: hypothetical protein AMQ22_02062 [Candidatus Methanofastidiosum methylthiophilus]